MASLVIERSIVAEEEDPSWFAVPPQTTCDCFCGGCRLGSLHCYILACGLVATAQPMVPRMDEEEDDCLCAIHPGHCPVHDRRPNRTQEVIMDVRENPHCKCDDATKRCPVHG